MLLRTVGRIFKEDIVSSLTGGFFFDSAQSHFVNLVHIYTWIIFFVSPLITYLVSSGLVGGLVYSFFTMSLVSFIKFLIWRLHRVLDTKEPVAVVPDPAPESFTSKSNLNTDSRRPTFPSTSDSSSDHDQETFDQELEDRCRRVGQAGLDMADLFDALHGNQTVVPRQLPSPSTESKLNWVQEFDQQHSETLDTAVLFAKSEVPVNPDTSLFSPSDTPADCILKNRDGDGPEININIMTTRTQNNNSNSQLTPGLIRRRRELLARTNTLHVPPSSHIASRLPVQRQSSLTSALPYSDVKRQRLMFGLPSTAYRGTTDPIERLLDEHRMISRLRPAYGLAAGDLVNTTARSSSSREPPPLHRTMTAHVDLVRADMEQCRRAIIQMKADLDHLPVGWNKPSEPKLEVLDQHPCKGTRAFNRTARRSGSQRHRRTLLSTNLHIFRPPFPPMTHFPPSALHNRVTPTVDLTDFALTDAIAFWRQHFTNTDTISQGTRSNSLRQPVRWNLGSTTTSERPDRGFMARRSHSLRQSHQPTPHFYPVASRPTLRRPGSALRLRRQESTEDSSSLAQSNLVGGTNINAPSTLAKELVSDQLGIHLGGSSATSNVDLALDGKSSQNNLPVPSTSYTATLPAAGDALVPSTSNSNECQPSSSSYSVINLDATGESDGTLNKNNFQEESTSGVKMRVGLVRKPGIRRKGAPTSAQLGAPIYAYIPISSGEPQREPTDSATPAISTLQAPAVSTSVPTSQSDANQTVDELLAQLMGVRSLAEAGLTREQCLAQLRGSGDNVDSENAELDILFAVAAASDQPREPPKQATQESNESLCTLALLFDGDRAQRLDTLPRPTPSRTSSRDRSTPVPRESEDSIRVWLPPRHIASRPSPVPNTKVYELRVFPRLPFTITLRVGRLQLDALFDRWLSWWEALLSILVSLLVSVIGYLLLCSGSLSTASVVMFCFAIAGCHYSLVKSVQPDAASPQHGFNRVIVYSRAVFFCLIAAIFVTTNSIASPSSPSTGLFPTFMHEEPTSLRLVSFKTGELSLVKNTIFSSSSSLLVSSAPLIDKPKYPPVHSLPRTENRMDSIEPTTFSLMLFGTVWSTAWLASFVRSLTYSLLFIYPILFPLGLIPQLNTALIYVLEQIDIHVFGGSGAVGLFSACFTLLRNAVVLTISYWFCLIAVKTENPYHLCFSTFWSIYLPLCFLQSRLPSNLRLYATLLPSSNFYWAWRTRTWPWIVGLCRSSCFDKLRSRTGKRGAKRRCFWQKGDKSSRNQEQRVVWWRTWLPFISDMGKKSSSQIKSSGESVVSDRLMRSPSARRRHLENISALRLQRRIHSQSAKLAAHRSGTGAGQQFGSYPSVPTWDLVTEPLQLLNNQTHSLDEIYLRDSSTISAVLQGDLKESRLRDSNSQQTHNTAFFEQPDNVRETQEGREVNEPPTPASAPPLTRFHPQAPLHAAGDVRKTTASVDFSHIKNPGQRGLRTKRSTLSGSESSGEGKRDTIRARQFKDPLPLLIHEALVARLQNDFICCILWAISVFGIHASSLLVYATSHSWVSRIIMLVAIINGAFLHYIWPNLRKPYPWLCFTKPPITPHARGELMRFEIVYFWLCWIERNVLMPTITVLTATQSMPFMVIKFEPHWTCAIILVTSMKMLRHGFNAAGGRIFLFLLFTELLFTFDFYNQSEFFPLNYFFVSIFVNKFIELVHKLHFVYIYTAPFRFTWGSCTHALIQIASVPHTLFMLGNCFISTVLSSPLEPILASAVFITSYARPIKFWEVTHRTERMETTNTALASQLRGVTEKQVAGNLNAIFYEHLTRNLQSVLAGDIQLGRVGGMAVNSGDLFIFSSEDINLVIHIIEVGNGLVTFQLRGLEFSGTSCHERETEALRCTSHNTDGCCCFNPGHHPGMLSVNAALRMRWMTWQFIYGLYNVSGYRMTTHGADTIVRMTDFRKVLVNRFVQCIIFYVLQLHDLSQRLDTLAACLHASNLDLAGHFDLDPVFLRTIDEDYDEQCSGVTKQRFVKAYGDWIRFCLWKKGELAESLSCEDDSPLVSLCYALSLLGRRCMGGIQSAHYDVNQVLRGIHDIFKGDIRVMTKDDWVLTDLDLLQSVVTPAMRIALKLYQDEFLWTPECTNNTLYRKIVYTEKKFVICHETDPMWRFAVLNDACSLFSLRWVGADSDDMYRFVQLTRSKLQFRAVKINPECVRGLWAGQQREQIYLRNTNVERGSIQMAQHVLRNLVNSSCDPPIGYPIYVSPILTSFAGTNAQYTKAGGPELSFPGILRLFLNCLTWIRKCFQRLRHPTQETPSPERPIELTDRSHADTKNRSVSWDSTSRGRRDRDTLHVTDPSDTPLSHWPSFTESDESLHQKRPEKRETAHLTTLAALVHEHYDTEGLVPVGGSRTSPRTKVMIIDPTQILNDRLNKLMWPSKEWRTHCLTQSLCNSSVYSGLEGHCVHRWTPSNPDPSARSFCHRTIALVAFPNGPPLLDGLYVAIWEDKGLIEVSPEGEASGSGQPTRISLLQRQQSEDPSPSGFFMTVPTTNLTDL